MERPWEAARLSTYFEEESEGLDNRWDVGVSKREDSRMNPELLLSNRINLRERERPPRCLLHLGGRLGGESIFCHGNIGRGQNVVVLM